MSVHIGGCSSGIVQKSTHHLSMIESKEVGHEL